MGKNGAFRYDRKDEPDLIALYCGECESEWGNMPIHPNCGARSEMWLIDSDSEEILRHYVDSGQTKYFTREIIDALVMERDNGKT